MDTHASVEAYAPSTASKRLVEAYVRHGEATVGLMEVAEDDVQKYGIVGMDGLRIVSMTEKPSPEDAPSRLALCGRYVFPANTQDLLKTYTYEAHGDLQSIALQQHWMKEGALYGVVLDQTQWYDSGAPLLWLKAQVDHALRALITAMTCGLGWNSASTISADLASKRSAVRAVHRWRGAPPSGPLARSTDDHGVP